MTLTYSHTPVPVRERRHPRDLRKKCVSAIHSYQGEDGHEYRYEFFVERGKTPPAPPAILEHGISLNSQVPGLLVIWG